MRLGFRSPYPPGTWLPNRCSRNGILCSRRNHIFMRSCLPQVGVITNVGPSHAERAGSLEAIAQGKAELVQALPKAPLGVAILNADDPYVRAMAEKTEANVFFYGLDPCADVWADEIESDGLKGIRFQLHFHDEVLSIRVPMIGRHSVHTILRAAAVDWWEGMTWQEIIHDCSADTRNCGWSPCIPKTAH